MNEPTKEDYNFWLAQAEELLDEKLDPSIIDEIDLFAKKIKDRSSLVNSISFVFEGCCQPLVTSTNCDTPVQAVGVCSDPGNGNSAYCGTEFTTRRKKKK